jgi:hypothetical protein
MEDAMFHIDREMLNPNIGVTVRFTSILYNWLKQVSKREGISFNTLVLQCCKNCMEMDLSDDSETAEADKEKK